MRDVPHRLVPNGPSPDRRGRWHAGGGAGLDPRGLVDLGEVAREALEDPLVPLRMKGKDDDADRTP